MLATQARFHQKGILTTSVNLHSRGVVSVENGTKGDVTELMTGESSAARAERVSVVIPAYSVAGFLEETLQSVFAQTMQPFEILVINDGSPDSPALERMLAPYLDRIRYLVQENQGPSAARNRGLDAATGDLIAFLDGDDVWLPGYVAQQIEYLRAHPADDLVYCNAIFLWGFDLCRPGVYDGVSVVRRGGCRGAD